MDSIARVLITCNCYHLRMRHNMFRAICLSVLFRLSIFDALTYKLHFQCTSTSNVWDLGQVLVSRSWGQGQGHMTVTKYTFMGGLPLSERQSCRIIVSSCQKFITCARVKTV